MKNPKPHVLVERSPPQKGGGEEESHPLPNPELLRGLVPFPNKFVCLLPLPPLSSPGSDVFLFFFPFYSFIFWLEVGREEEVRGRREALLVLLGPFGPISKVSLLKTFFQIKLKTKNSARSFKSLLFTIFNEAKMVSNNYF